MDRIRAAVVTHGAPGNLSLREVEPPSAAANEALVRVAATSLNLGEVRGAQSSPEGARPGWDLAGTVERAAADGSGPPRGARVAGTLRSGAWAELVAVPTDALAELPARVSFADAATLPVAGLTALHALEKGTRLLARTVLVTGASGGVGHFACQLARLSGARVVGLIRHREYEPLVREAGAEQVAVSEDASAAAGFGPYRLIVEGVGGPVLATAMGMLAPDGVCVAFAGSAGSEITFDLWSFVRAGRPSLYGLMLRNELALEPASIGMARLAQLVSEGRVRPHISVEAPWDQIGLVARDLLDRKIPGKAVLHTR